MDSRSKKMELGWAYPKRKKYLDDLSGKVTGKTQAEYFQNRTQDFVVHIIPIELPKYRIDNGRTYAAQAQYIAKGEVPEDFFTRDHESDAVQAAQHAILKGMMKESGLYDHFKKHEQSDAIILSHEGYVINGNRRLCAWRELLEKDKKEYAHLNHIRAIILPPADAKDIDELEARLQVHKDIKADYTWTSRSLMLRHRQSSYDYTTSELADLFEMTEDAVEELIDMLSYAETYLESRDKVGQYSLVDRAEYAFREIHKKRSKVKGEPYKEVFEKLAFCLIDSDSNEGRLYKNIPDIANNLDKIIEALQDELNIEEDSQSQGVSLLGGGGYQSLDTLIDAINSEPNFEQAKNIVLDIIESERAKEKEKSQRNFVHSQVKKANTALIEAIAAIDRGTQKEGISAQLISIENSIEKLKEWLFNEDKN